MFTYIWYGSYSYRYIGANIQSFYYFFFNDNFFFFFNLSRICIQFSSIECICNFLSGVLQQTLLQLLWFQWYKGSKETNAQNFDLYFKSKFFLCRFLMKCPSEFFKIVTQLLRILEKCSKKQIKRTNTQNNIFLKYVGFA